MNVYFMILMVLQCVGLGIDLVRHGTERIVKDNFVASFIARIIAVVLLYFAVKTGF